jgi:hypothetical protein
MAEGGPSDPSGETPAEIWQCADDPRRMEPVPGEPEVRRCPACGHRTDQPGTGVLGDGFDVAPEQWGLRGDPHAWRGMRDLLATTPTPPDTDAVRAAYVEAFRQVTGVDLDGIGDDYVYVAHLDHGGMSGGGLDLNWWRTRGLPLLVERASDRRPPPDPAPVERRRQPAAAGGSKLGNLMIDVVVFAIPLAAIAAGAFLLVQRATDDRVDATVIECERSGGVVGGVSTARIDCTASWTEDGQAVIGPFTGGLGESDVGKTVAATVRDGIAYSAEPASLVLPLVLIGLGLLILVVPVLGLRARRRGA